MTSALRAGLETAAPAANAVAKTKAWSHRVRKTDSLTIRGSVRHRVDAESRRAKRARSQGMGVPLPSVNQPVGAARFPKRLPPAGDLRATSGATIGGSRGEACGRDEWQR